MLDNKLVQIALVFLAFYVILQMMNGQVSQEHLDTVVQVQSSGLPQTTVQIQQPSAVSTSIPAAANSLVTPELAATSSSASAVPVVTSAPSAAITNTIPAPLTSVEEDLAAAAPQVLPEDLQMGKQNANIFAPEPQAYDALFGKRNSLEHSEIIPKVQDVELYGGRARSPELAENFLNNRWSSGIQTSVSGKGKGAGDLRGFPAMNPMSIP